MVKDDYLVLDIVLKDKILKDRDFNKYLPKLDKSFFNIKS